MGKKLKILFISECVTLAHIARPYTLACGLDAESYDVTLAWNKSYPSLFPSFPFKEKTIHSMKSSEFTDRLKKGSVLYNRRILEEYIREDEKLFNECKPDIVVGDFRLSLAISARLAKIPWINLTNAYWSLSSNPKFIVPDLSIVNLFGIRLAQKIFDFVRPIAFGVHALPISGLMKKNGLTPPPLNIANMYVQGDYTFFCDSPYLVPIKNLPSNQEYLGPILWSPDIQKPAWWNEAIAKKPIVYITLGSSGDPTFIPKIINAMRDLPVTILLATAVKEAIPDLPRNVYQSPYLPGIEASKYSDLVICNGGSPTTQQALSQGVPVLGIASNLDQYLNMSFVEKAGVGKCLRAGLFDPLFLRETIVGMLKNNLMKKNALEMKKLFSETDSIQRFNSLLEKHFT